MEEKNAYQDTYIITILNEEVDNDEMTTKIKLYRTQDFVATTVRSSSFPK